MDTINFSDARKSLSSVIDGVTENANYTLIKRRKKPDAVLMSLDFFNGMMETLHLLSNPNNASHLMRGIEAHKKGQAEAHELLDV